MCKVVPKLVHVLCRREEPMYTSALGHKRNEGFSDRRQSEPILLSCPHAAGKHRKEAHWFLPFSGKPSMGLAHLWLKKTNC
jgi:hypothetical protein